MIITAGLTISAHSEVERFGNVSLNIFGLGFSVKKRRLVHQFGAQVKGRSFFQIRTLTFRFRAEKQVFEKQLDLQD